MNRPPRSVFARIKSLLQLPKEAGDRDVYDCVVDCLSDALDCNLVPPATTGGSVGFSAAWISPTGRRYEGSGGDGRAAVLAAALRLIEESPEAVILRIPKDLDALAE